MNGFYAVQTAKIRKIIGLCKYFFDFLAFDFGFFFVSLHPKLYNNERTTRKIDRSYIENND